MHVLYQHAFAVCQHACTCNVIMHAQYIIVQAQQMNMHARNANMTHAQYIIVQAQRTCMHKMLTWHMHTPYMPTCIHNISTCDMHIQHAVMQAQCTCTWHSPNINFEVVNKPSLLGNKINVRSRWENHSQPAKGCWVCCIRYQCCTHRSQGRCAETN